MHQHVRTWAVVLLTAAVAGAPALRNHAAVSPRLGRRVSKRVISHPRAPLQTRSQFARALARRNERSSILPTPRASQGNASAAAPSTPEQPVLVRARRANRASPPTTSLLTQIAQFPFVGVARRNQRTVCPASFGSWPATARSDGFSACRSRAGVRAESLPIERTGGSLSCSIR